MFGGGCFSAPGGYGGGGGGGYGRVEAAGEAGPCGGVQASQGFGGFIPGDNGGSARPEQPDGGAGKTAAQTLTPVTIRMLLDAVSSSGQLGPDGAFRVNGGRELQMLSVVACVESIKNQQMSICLTLNDGTGRISCNMYSDSDSASSGPEFQDGDYIRVFGHLRQWDQQEGITAHRIVKVESANEIAHHTIEVAHVHLSVVGKLVKSGVASGQANRSSPMSSMPASMQPPMNAQQVGGAANRYAQGAGTGTQQFPSAQTPQFAGMQQANTLPAASTFHQPVAGSAAPMGTFPPRTTQTAQMMSGQPGYQQPQMNAQPLLQQQPMQMQTPQPQMHMGYGGVQGGSAAQARTSPFQGGPGGQYQPSGNMPLPGGAQGSLYGGAGGNSLYGTAAGPGGFR